MTKISSILPVVSTQYWLLTDGHGAIASTTDRLFRICLLPVILFFRDGSSQSCLACALLLSSIGLTPPSPRLNTVLNVMDETSYFYTVRSEKHRPLV